MIVALSPPAPGNLSRFPRRKSLRVPLQTGVRGRLSLPPNLIISAYSSKTAVIFAAQTRPGGAAAENLLYWMQTGPRPGQKGGNT
jgi:hypothetical protein